MKRDNSYDILMEKLVEEFSKIPNFSLTQSDDDVKKMINMTNYRMVEIITYKNLVCSSFVPAANKAIFLSKKEYIESKYAALISANNMDFRETLYETIRLSYVGLFHKIENFTNDLISMVNILHRKTSEDKQEFDIMKWTKEHFQFRIKDWDKIILFHKINWISNCVKHYDGFPVKQPKPLLCRHYNESNRMRIEVNEFKEDCDRLIEFYPQIIRLMFFFVQYKFLTDMSHEIDYDKNLSLVEKFKSTESAMKDGIDNLIKLLSPDTYE